MKWIAVAILVFVVGYTVVNLLYRKRGPAFRPYEDMNRRATTARLLNAGWQKAPLEFRRPVEATPLLLAAAVRRGAPGLGAELQAAFAEPLTLPDSVDRVTAPGVVARGARYPVFFTATVADQHREVARLELLRRDRELVLLPVAEQLPGKDLLARWPDNGYATEFATDRLPPGRYHARLVARGAALEWTFEVQ